MTIRNIPYAINCKHGDMAKFDVIFGKFNVYNLFTKIILLLMVM
jgi:hypothetical protein